MKRFVSPLLGLSIFSVASGYLITLIPLRINEANASQVMAGYLGGIYYFGLLAGSFRAEKTVLRIGHIRSFAAFMALLCASTLSLALLDSMYAWLILRFLNGIAIAGIFVVVESWLLCESDQSNRGRILAFYMVSLYGSNAIGQLLVGTYPADSLLPFVLIGAIFSLSILPPAMTKLPTPELADSSSLSLRELARLTPSGLIGCVSGGMILGALYSLLPILLLKQSGDQKTVGQLMAIVMVGGMLLQYPVGLFSDIVDRRKVLVVISLAGASCCFAFATLSSSPWLDIVLLFLIGGTTFTVYPIAISHGCDHLRPEKIVAGTQGLLLGYSAGACIGPILGGYFMHQMSSGLMIYFTVMMGATGLFFLARIPFRPIIYSSDEQPFVPVPRTSPVIAQIDPRSEVDLEDTDDNATSV
ncbi:MFS transporter [Parendozoicomonas haliclonae]|uniref:Putative MFS-type transporter YcaD n=2 Tax=Parendozoicomonas haliclonae TaxID=1960125 RepID=A0A1X7AS75_9GAMM|nr:putative MFS-type transporter YcaD [Parendozoicomonas haliclonae]